MTMAEIHLSPEEYLLLWFGAQEPADPPKVSPPEFEFHEEAAFVSHSSAREAADE